MRVQVARLCKLMQICALGLLLTLVACGEEPGRVRAAERDVAGRYQTNFTNGQEKLEIKSDHTYVQDFESKGRSFHHTGNWKLDTHFLNGSDITLIGAVLSEDDPVGTSQRVGDRTLNVHKHSDKLALALNEVADWYYERVE